jgi:tellurite resistance protein TerC
VLASSDGGSGGVDLDVSPMAWVLLLGLITVLLLVDILIIHRSPHRVSLREAAVESAVWISIGLAFGVGVWVVFGGPAFGEYLSAYLIEKSLSIDNVFVWAVIFSYFAVPREFQHRVLFWGIFGALVMRGIFIFAGVALLERFEWLLFVFGGFLLYTAVKLAVKGDEDVDPGTSRFVRWIRRVVPSTEEYHGAHLFAKVGRHRMATPLFIVLLVVEMSDLIFAVDSVPAVLAISRETFIVFSSNAFAILGLRALYFLLADLHARFSYLQQGLAIILGFVGIKMIASHWVHIPTGVSLAVIALVLAVSIGMSIKRPVAAEADTLPPLEPFVEEPPPPQER